MGAVVVASRYVPRPPDDNIWNAKSTGFSAPLALALLNNVPFKPLRWRFDYNEPGFWLNSSARVANVLRPVTAVAPFVPNRWQNTFDDAGVWTGEPGSAFSLLSQTLQLYNPSPMRNYPAGDVGDGWSGNKRSVNNLLLNSSITPPVIPSRWRFDHQDPDPGFVVESATVPAVQRLVNGNYPFKPPYWKYNNDDYGVWSGKPSNVNRVIDLAFVPPLIPTRWKLDYDDSAVWYTKPGNVPPLRMPVGGGFPFVPTFWKSNYDDSGVWQNKPFGPSLLLELASGTFKPTFWRYNTDEPGTWNGGPVNVSIVQQIIATTPLQPKKWLFDIDEAPPWNGAPSDVSVNITQPGPPVPTPTVGSVGWIGRKRWWEELQEEYVERYRRDNPEAKPTKAKQAIKARKALIADVTEAAQQGLLIELNAKPLVELVSKAVTSPKLVEALEYARQAREYLDQLYEEDEEEFLIMAISL